jgi:UDP-N-acetylglucosamine 2-epimerase (non-hydrolysing)
LENICHALRRVADDLPQISIVFPVHPQPRVRETTDRLLRGQPRISLIDPLGYLEFVAAMRACAFVVTDSGGIQEEAPVLAKPVLVLRAVTERPEAIEAGTSFLVGTDEADVYAHVVSLATDMPRRERMAHAASPFGDGRASERIVAAIHRFAGLPPLADEPPPLPVNDVGDRRGPKTCAE